MTSDNAKDAEIASLKKKLEAQVQLNRNQGNTISSQAGHFHALVRETAQLNTEKERMQEEKHKKELADMQKKHDDEMAELLRDFAIQGIGEELPRKKARVADGDGEEEGAKEGEEKAEVEGEKEEEEPVIVIITVPTEYCRYGRRCKTWAVCTQAGKKHEELKQIAKYRGFYKEFKEGRLKAVYAEQQVLVTEMVKVRGASQ
jgi:hypothetical protein